MTLRNFIERPVLSSVISIFIVILGLIALFTLPVEQYPDIAPPTVMVQTTYYGASAETLQKSVIAPLEEAINGVENMTYMTSTASNAGTVEIYVYFRQGTDPDMAAVNVQNRVSTATGQLPSDVTDVGVTTIKRQTSMLQVFSLYSPDDSYTENFMANYISINLKPEILRIQGVGTLVVLGSDYSMRIWMKPDVMAQYALVPSDVTEVLAEQNIESATGSIGENSAETFQYTMKYTGRLLTPEEFGDIVIRSTDDGEVLRLRDVADIELGQDTYSYIGRLNGHPSISCMVFQTAGSNSTQVNKQIDAFLEEAEKDLPKGIALTQMMSTDDFLYASINEVVKTLLEVVVLVVLVVFLFLQNLRATLIPLVGVVVSLVGTFAFMSIMGFSINLLTLFALVLVIGTVVDNSIVVVEAVQARFDVGYMSSYMASIDAVKGISNAVITSSLVFMAVFIPVSFMGGTSGTFYTQFGLTMAVSVGISAINALTLSPALCALLMRPDGPEALEGKSFMARYRRAFRIAMAAMVDRYKQAMLIFFKKKWLTWGILIVSLVLLVYLMRVTKTGLVPDEDQGVVLVTVTTPSGSSLATTDKIMQRLTDRLTDVTKLDRLSRTSGYSLISGQSNSAGMLIVRLKDWDERTRERERVPAIQQEIYAKTADIKDASVFAMAPPMISGYGNGNSLDVNVLDRLGGDVETLYEHTINYVNALNQRPEIGRAYTSFAVNFPQWEVSVDAAKCKRAGVAPNTVLGVLAGYYGGQYVSDFNRFTKVYRVMIQASPDYRLDEASLSNAFVRMDNGDMAPLSQFIRLRRVYGAETLSRFNMYSSISVSVMPADGCSTGDALRAVKEVAQASLPKGYGIDFGGITREENEQANNTAIIFCICIVMIYLILCALYESFLIPFSIILAVPAGLMGSFLCTKLMGLENNIYLQTGLIMLIGLLAKTAILLTEYAVNRRKAGMSLTSAALSAAKARLRPILMTVLTMVFGLFPLMAATGVGANGNRSLGSGVIGGLVIGTLVLLVIVPTLFIVFQWIQERIRPLQPERSHDWQIQEAQIEEDEARRRHLEEKKK